MNSLDTHSHIMHQNFTLFMDLILHYATEMLEIIILDRKVVQHQLRSCVCVYDKLLLRLFKRSLSPLKIDAAYNYKI